jgi:hypothetical protein
MAFPFQRTNRFPLVEGPMLPWMFVWQFRQDRANILFLPDAAVPMKVSKFE